MASRHRDAPAAQLVRYNDWRQVDLPPLAGFRPELPVSVIVPYSAQFEELGWTLAALEGQTFPRELFEVVVVDDGSPEPLSEVGGALLGEAPFEVRVVRQEGPGFGLARARNTGARVAAHEVLLFLDAGLLPEADWLLAHARWHHAVPDAVTLGLRVDVFGAGVDAEAIRERPGSLKEIFAGRRADRAWYEAYWAATNDLAAKADDLFRVVAGGNCGIRRGFCELVGGFDESFTNGGGEDTEFGYRAFTRGALLVPVRDGGFAWRQVPGANGRTAKERKSARARMSHRIAHPSFRMMEAPGRTFTVPQFVVTIRGGVRPAEDLREAVERLLAGSVHDLVVRLELPGDHADRAWLECELSPDPRVQVALPDTALLDFPASPFQVILPAEKVLIWNVVHELRVALGSAVLGECVFPDGSRASIARSWALHRAHRTPWEAPDFGEVVTIPPVDLEQPGGGPPLASRGVEAARRAWSRFRVELRRVDGPRTAWRFIRWFARAFLRRVSLRFYRAPQASPSGASRSPGVEIVALGGRSRAVFEASAGTVRTTADQPVHLAVADTVADAAGAKAPVVVLEEAPPSLSVPALDPAEHNPIGWSRGAQRTVGALGPLEHLPAGVRADCVTPAADWERIRSLHHLEDVAAFHPDAVARAATLVRLAARGTVVHLADEATHLEGLLGAGLHGLLAGAVPGSDPGAREALSIRIRREALREHSLGARARQLCAAAGVEGPPLPLVSVLLVTKRPALLAHALAGVARQTWPRVELVLGLHGGGFAGVDERLRELPLPSKVVRIGAEEPLGAALNCVAAAARGALLTKMDDDDAYGREHLWDLVLAQEYSQADLVTKTAEFVYLAGPSVTVQLYQGNSERHVPGKEGGAGGTILLPREALDRVGGFPPVPIFVDQRLFEHMEMRGGRVYRTHGAGFVLVRHGSGHTWEGAGNEWFLDRAYRVWRGFDPERAHIEDMAHCWLPGPFTERLR